MSWASQFFAATIGTWASKTSIEGAVSDITGAPYKFGNPPAPIMFLAVAAGLTAAVSFVDGGAGSAGATTGYTVLAYKAGVLDATVIDSNAGTLSLTHTMTGLVGGSSYTFTAVANNVAGASAQSAQSNVIVASSGALRAVASGTFIPSGATSANQSVGGASSHIVMRATNSLVAVWGNWRAIANAGESAGPGDVVMSACVEYPVGGTRYPFTFGGSSQGTITAGNNIVTDTLTLPVTIPIGAEISIITLTNGASGTVNFAGYAANTKLRYQGSATLSSIPDYTTAGSTGNYTVTASQAGGIYMGPMEILTADGGIAVHIAGDSKSNGATALAVAGDFFQGHLGRACGAAGIAYGHHGTAGDTLTGFIAGHSRRVALMQYYTHVLTDMGINDVANGVASATLIANTATYHGYFTGKVIGSTTLSPYTGSTDSYATAANQTSSIGTAKEQVKTDVNTSRLSLAGGLRVCYDMDTIVGTAGPSSRVWQGATPSLTTEGLHYTKAGAIQGAAGINLSAFLAMT